MESLAQTEVTRKGSSTRAATRETAARPAPKTFGELLLDIPVLAAARRRRIPLKRSPSFKTWKRMRLWAAVTEHPGITTAEAGLQADVSRPKAEAALKAIAAEGWITSTKVGRSHQAHWTTTPRGIKALFDTLSRRWSLLSMGYTREGISHRQKGTATNGVLSVIIEGFQDVSRRMKKLGWNRKGIELAIRSQRLDYLLWQIRDVEGAPGLRNPGAVLRCRLFDPKNAERRREAMASNILRTLSEGVRGMFLAATEREGLSPGNCLKLAYALRSMHRRGRQVTPGDVSGMAGQLRKRIAAQPPRRRRG